MDLKEALGVLSKASPFAVTTSGEIVDPELRELKQCLYVETDVEKAFRSKLGAIKPGDIIFLCGSSGDGKSEVLTRYKKDHEALVDFHLDATHSFAPDKSAIDTLDEVFSRQNINNRALVVGINIGMLANYEREGSDLHSNIKEAINAFLNEAPVDSKYTFLDFESFPKFTIENGRANSSFFRSLLDNVVKDDSENKFRDYFNRFYGDPREAVLFANYLMLRDRRIQNVIVELLFNARIRKDQFVSTRMLLDFTYSILTGPAYLFDNLFNGGDNELLAVLTEFDPCVIRNHKLDLFVLHRTLELEDKKYSEFLEELVKHYELSKSLSPDSVLRLFFILKNCQIGNNYHLDFKDFFNEEPLNKYNEVWEAHKNYNGDSSDKKWLREFYSGIVLKAINMYANRNAPYLTKDEFYLSSHGGCDLAAEVELSINYKSIQTNKSEDLAAFNMYLEVDGEKLDPIPIGLNLLALLMKIIDGYRPNKYDKNSVVLLDELIAKITEMASVTDTLYLYKGNERIKLKANSDNEIRVSGL